MLKKLLMLLIAVALSISGALAAPVDVNTADQATLQTLKGLGPVKSKAIIDERAKNGPFKDADDLANRVKGLGVKSVTKLESEGLNIGGSSTPPTGKGSTKGTSSSKTSSTQSAASSPTAMGKDTAMASAPSSKASKKKKAKSAAAASAASGT